MLFNILGCDDYSCATGAQCIISKTGPTCVCPEGMVGNPFPGGACRRDVCGSGVPCEEPLTCVAGRCRQRCEGIVCGVGASCDQNTGKCVCNAFFVGNPDLLCMPREYLLYVKPTIIKLWSRYFTNLLFLND